MHSHQVGGLRENHPTFLPLVSDSLLRGEMFTHIYLVLPGKEVALSSFLLAEVAGRQVIPCAENVIGMREPARALGGEGILVRTSPTYFSHRWQHFTPGLLCCVSGAESSSVD